MSHAVIRPVTASHVCVSVVFPAVREGISPNWRGVYLPPMSSGPRKERGRWTSKRKREAVLRLLRGEDLDVVSREMKVTAATLARNGGRNMSGLQRRRWRASANSTYRRTDALLTDHGAIQGSAHFPSINNCLFGSCT